MEEASVHRCAIQRSQGAAEGVGQDGFTAVAGDDLPEAGGDFVESLVPGDALECAAELRSAWTAEGGRPHTGSTSPHTCGCWPLRGDSSHGIQHTIRRVHPVEILGYLGAQESASYGMGGIALNFGGAPVFHRNQYATRVWTIMRAGSVDDLFHSDSII